MSLVVSPLVSLMHDQANGFWFGVFGTRGNPIRDLDGSWPKGFKGFRVSRVEGFTRAQGGLWA